MTTTTVKIAKGEEGQDIDEILSKAEMAAAKTTTTTSPPWHGKTTSTATSTASEAVGASVPDHCLLKNKTTTLQSVARLNAAAAYKSERANQKKQRLDLLERAAQVQSKYLQSEGLKAVCNCLLDGLLDLIGSEFGFVGELRKDEDGLPCLHVHASTNVAWNAATRIFYEDNKDKGVRFYNMDTSFRRHVCEV